MILPALLIAGAVLVGAAILKKDEEPGPQVQPPERAPFPPPTAPFPGVEVPNFPAVSIPPTQSQIPGGTYVEGKGWCPPMYQYDPVTGLCAPLVIAEFPFPIQNLVQTSGPACCDSCTSGGPCTGCS